MFRRHNTFRKLTVNETRASKICGHDLYSVTAARVERARDRFKAKDRAARPRRVLPGGRRPPNINTAFIISHVSIPTAKTPSGKRRTEQLVDSRMTCYETIYKYCEWRFATSAKVASQHFPMYSVVYSVHAYVNLYMVGTIAQSNEIIYPVYCFPGYIL